MGTPITIGTTPIVVLAKNLNRSAVRFQNTGETTLYFYRAPGIPSPTNYEFLLEPSSVIENDDSESKNNGNDDNNGNHNVKVFVSCNTVMDTDSVKQFNAVSSGAGGKLAIYETVDVLTF